jgi:hypothetical protein
MKKDEEEKEEEETEQQNDIMRNNVWSKDVRRRPASLTAAAAASSHNKGGKEDCKSNARPQPMKPPSSNSNNHNNNKWMGAILQQHTLYKKILVVLMVVLIWFACAYLWTYQELSSMSSHHSRGNHEHAMLPLIRGVPQPQEKHQHSTAVTRTSTTISKTRKTKSNNNSTTTTTTTTLVLLYPPGLMGGYRNQVIRFVSLVQYALDHHIHQLLQNSLLWATQVRLDDVSSNHQQHEEVFWYPIPMDLLFDLDHWNTFAPQQLPRIVKWEPNNTTTISSDCWQWNNNGTTTTTTTIHMNHRVSRLTQHVLNQGMLPSMVNLSHHLLLRTPTGRSINMRRLDLLPLAQQALSSSSSSSCQNTMILHGGGKGAGRLWNDYMEREQSKTLGNTPALVLQALQPKLKWRQWATSRCIQAHVLKGMVNTTSTTTTTPSSSSSSSNYVALHARMELEMMDHTCGHGMLRNLTTLLEMVEQFLPPDIHGVLVAVSRHGMEERDTALYRKFQAHADENLATLNRAVRKKSSTTTTTTNQHVDDTTSGLKHGTVPVFECGQQVIDEYYQEHPDSIDYGSLLPSMLNFHVATEASIFIGVRHSSYSTDIWTTRYHQGKGLSNYEYTPQGIFPMENQGLPPPHKNCQRKQRSSQQHDTKKRKSRVKQ